MGLEVEQVNVLKKCFDGFCQDGSIHVDTVGTIFNMMGLRVKPSALKEIIEEVLHRVALSPKQLNLPVQGRRRRIGLLGIRGVLPAERQVSRRRRRGGNEEGAQGGVQDLRQGRFEEIAAKLNQSYANVSKGNGYIPTSALKEILHELDAKLTDQELDGIIDEIDEDGSGTVDFDGNDGTICNGKSIYIYSFQSSWK
jgi:Ca2+-binding EF-hand superfamily protein